MRKLLAILLFPCSVLAQAPQTITQDQHNETVSAIIKGRDSLVSNLQNEIAGLTVLLERAKREAEKKECKPEWKK